MRRGDVPDDPRYRRRGGDHLPRHGRRLPPRWRHGHVGRTEEIVGRWLEGRRDDYIVATKCVGRHRTRAAGSGARPASTSSTPSTLRCAGSGPTTSTSTSCTAPTPTPRSTRRSSALDTVVRSGKARYVGCSNFLAYRVARAIGRSEALGPGPVRFGAAPLQPALPPDRAGPAAPLWRGGHRRHPLQPDRRRPAHRQARSLGAARRGHPLHAGHGRRHVQGPVLARGRVRHRRGAPGRWPRRRACP